MVPDFPSASLPRQMEIVATRTARHKDGFVYNGGCVCLNQADIDSPDENTVLFDYDVTPDISVALENIVSYQYDCDSTKLFFVDVADSLRIWEIDEVSGDLSLYDAYCNFSVKHDFQLADVQHYNAIPWEDCQRIIDLDEDDSSGAVGIDYHGDSVCVHTDLSIADGDLLLKNEQALDSIVIYVDQALAGQGLQISTGNYDLLIQADSKVSILDNGNTSLTEMEQALLSARYVDTAPYRSGDIEIIFEPWYRGVQGTAAIAFLHIPEKPNAGADLFLEFCVEDALLDVDDLLEGSISPGFFYEKNGIQLSDTQLDLSVPQSYDLYYISGTDICADTACIEIEILPLPPVIAVQDIVSCDSDTVVIDLQDLEGTITWSDDDNEKLKKITTSGNYYYEHIGSNGCITREEFVVDFLPNQTEEEITYVDLCVGESYNYQGEDYSEDIFLMDTVLSTIGCDSIISGLAISVLPSMDIVIEGSTQICKGSSANLQIVSPFDIAYLDGILVEEHMVLDESGIYQLEVIDDNGCAQMYDIEITNYEVSSVEIDPTEQLSFVDPIDIPVSYNGDFITFSWTPMQGLSCYDCPYPMLTEPGIEQYDLVAEDSFGCIYHNNFTITYENDTYYLPNIISPENELDINGSFHVMSNVRVSYDLIIYDRWGNTMYEADGLLTNEFSTGWIPDNNVQSGVYVYLVTMHNTEEETFTGSITVIK